MVYLRLKEYDWSRERIVGAKRDLDLEYTSWVGWVNWSLQPKRDGLFFLRNWLKRYAFDWVSLESFDLPDEPLLGATRVNFLHLHFGRLLNLLLLLSSFFIRQNTRHYYEPTLVEFLYSFGIGWVFLTREGTFCLFLAMFRFLRKRSLQNADW